MADVFISYAREDRSQAQQLAQALVAQRLSVWWDREILLGKAFDEVIERELDSARSVVVLWSTNSAKSEWVRNEAAAAAERGVLVPALIDNVRLPLEFRRRQTADLVKWRGDPNDAGFLAVCRSVRVNLGGAPVSRDTLPAGAEELALRQLEAEYDVTIIRDVRGSGAVRLDGEFRYRGETYAVKVHYARTRLSRNQVAKSLSEIEASESSAARRYRKIVYAVIVDNLDDLDVNEETLRLAEVTDVFPFQVILKIYGIEQLESCESKPRRTLPRVTAARENDAPFAVDAVVVEDDTRMVLGAGSEFGVADESIEQIVSNVQRAAPPEPGCVVVKPGAPLRLLAIVHDLSEEPTWKEEWIRDALVNLFREAARRKLKAIAIPPLGTKHGSIEHKRFVEIFNEVLALQSSEFVDRIWFVVPEGFSDSALRLLN